MNITDKLTALRHFMNEHALAAFIVPSTDPHAGEYVPEHWEARKWISGFTGSAGTAVITFNQAGLWTDSRYFIQAHEQLKGTGFTLFKDRLPETLSIPDWLGSVLPQGAAVGIDGWVNSTADTLLLEQQLNEQGLKLVSIADPFETLWEDRPTLPVASPFILPIEICGQSCKEKISHIRSAYHQKGADGLLVSALDEVAWTLNMRGADVHCNPVFVSYLLITDDNVTLYINKVKITADVASYLEHEGILLRDYQEIEEDICHYPGKCIFLPATTNYTLYKAALQQTKIVTGTSPIVFQKAVKNSTEIAGFRKAMRKDGVAMVKFLIWLQQAVKKGDETELSIDRQLFALRNEQEGFQGISFDTIAGYQEHGAIVHYEATPESAATLAPKGLLLLDSGGQYLEGTTDITRTIVLGPITDEQKKDYTLVLKGVIALSRISFPKGTCGTQLDVLARQYMWKEGINYGHGTGHGVGHFLNVHEGPHQFRMNHVPAVLQPGMTITNEPGIYREGQYGIRIENTMLIVPNQDTEFGEFYKFVPLTLCPIDLEAVVTDMLSADEKAWLNEYHLEVRRQISPLLDSTEQQWLEQATRQL